MKLHHQFDLNMGILNSFGKGRIALPPHIVEDLIAKLSKEGYTVLKSSAYFMGIPQSVTVVKEFTGPFASQFANKIRNDFDSVSRKLGIRELFE